MKKRKDSDHRFTPYGMERMARTNDVTATKLIAFPITDKCFKVSLT
jgi:hypothetical protein